MSEERPQDSQQPELNFISLPQAAQRFGLSRSHLRKLVRDKLIWGKKIGRDWVTTAEAVQAYLDTDRRPGPK
jgi:excisionase family DNA binding protein